LKILFIPDWRKNPYQKELEDGLKTLGVSSEFDSCFGWSLVIQLIFKRKKPDILHIHWTQPIMWTDSRVGTFFRTMGVLIKLIIFKLNGVAIVWTVHNLLSHDSQYPKLEYFQAERCRDRLDSP